MNRLKLLSASFAVLFAVSSQGLASSLLFKKVAIELPSNGQPAEIVTLDTSKYSRLKITVFSVDYVRLSYEIECVLTGIEGADELRIGWQKTAIGTFFIDMPPTKTRISLSGTTKATIFVWGQ